ncbi:polysaccharide deacetylase family protein [Gracilibacillus caseinilyticus]|uniref:Polysaccharide deacetylase family protein n=1 Tax=Gracilibacillus caseinilyticus TaxID=2932256 RepID=A0ABY4EXS6_9BACI|nr:polysaccharide deacetylase family protein [Gracilibacillus caseinilyticus]UOQ48770.1 polysaccharide deacetylase family protein [Gracilibacillus caseinilyticus]
MNATSKRIMIYIGVLLIFTLIILLMTFFQKDPNTPNTEETITQSKYEGVDIVTDVTYDDYRSAIHYPAFEIAELDDEIASYVQETKDNFFADLEDKDPEWLEKRSASFSLSFDIFPIQDNLYSIVFYKDTYLGGANMQQESKVYLVDLENGQFIKQNEIIANTKENKDQLYDQLKQAFIQSEDYQDFFFEEELHKWFYDESTPFSNMYIEEDQLVFIFNEYQVTAGAAGRPVIRIPLNDIKGIISKEWKDKLKIEEEESEEQEKPTEPEDDESEGKGDATESKIPDDAKKVAITFDDGPHPENTLEILDILDQYEMKATFFMLGSRVDFYPDIAREVAKRGHEIGNHTWHHKDLTTVGKAKIKEEVQSTADVIKEATGEAPTAFRPPYGAINDEIRSVVDLDSTLWTIDTEDWKSHDPDAILQMVKDTIEDGSIILMHDIHSTTVDGFKKVAAYLKQEGYYAVTVSQLNE